MLRKKDPPCFHQIKHAKEFSSLCRLFLSNPHLHSSDDGWCCSELSVTVPVLPFLTEQTSVLANSSRSSPANSSRSSPELCLCMNLPGEIHKHSSSFSSAFTNMPCPQGLSIQRVKSCLLPTLYSFVGSPFHGAAPIFNISFISFWRQLLGRGAFIFELYV